MFRWLYVQHGTRFHMGQQEPLYDLRWQFLRDLVWAVRSALRRIQTRRKVARLPDSWVTPPDLPPDTVWHDEGNTYGHMERLSVEVSKDIGLCWVNIDNWPEDKETALVLSAPTWPVSASRLMNVDELADFCREVLAALEGDEPAIDQQRYVEPWPGVRSDTSGHSRRNDGHSK